MPESIVPTDSPSLPLPAGRTWPDIELPDHSGVIRSLLEVSGGDPFFLHTWRGTFCPKEQTFFREVMLPLQEECDVSYTRLVSLSTESSEVSYAFRAGLGARWTFLSDTSRSVLAPHGLGESTDTEHHPYAPYGWLLMPDLTIAAAWNGYWYWGRPTAEEIRLSFRDAVRKVHADTWRVPPAAD